jgi:sensor domain CHASE-containing protein
VALLLKGTLMKKLVVSLLLLVAVVAGVGLYRGWFTVNQTRIRQDEDTARQEVHDLTQSVKTKAGNLADKVEK